MSYEDPQFGEVWVGRIRGEQIVILMRTSSGEFEWASRVYESAPHTFRNLKYLQSHFRPLSADDTP